MLNYLETNLENVTALEALDILINDFSMTSYTILFNGTQRIVTLASLRREYEAFGSILAEYIAPIKFWGGPRDSIDYYHGSLLTLLCDNVLRAWVKDGSYADLVESFVEC